jgi:hypothetical protein
MGRQIHFYMLPEDQNTFLRVVQERDPIVVITRDSDSAEVKPAADLGVSPDKTLCLWNRKLLPHLERKWVPEPGYYRVDSLNTPTLEFTSSFTATWEGKPGLGQGRLFGNFEPYLGKPPDFEKWYETLVRWIRQNYQKSPASSGGYVGPAAYEFYKGGGYLLPNILPPRTKEWLAEIGKQHARSRTPLRPSKHAKARSRG